MTFKTLTFNGATIFTLAKLINRNYGTTIIKLCDYRHQTIDLINFKYIVGKIAHSTSFYCLPFPILHPHRLHATKGHSNTCQTANCSISEIIYHRAINKHYSKVKYHATLREICFQ